MDKIICYSNYMIWKRRNKSDRGKGMTKKEFLQDIKESLEPEVSSAIVQENIQYYSEYIDGEVRKGRSEEEVINELGDPWALAKTIIDMQESQGNTQQGYYQESDNTSQETTAKKGSFWKKFLLIAGILFVVFTIFSVVSGIITILAPIAFPVLMVVFAIQIFKNIFKK